MGLFDRKISRRGFIAAAAVAAPVLLVAPEVAAEEARRIWALGGVAGFNDEPSGMIVRATTEQAEAELAKTIYLGDYRRTLDRGYFGQSSFPRYWTDHWQEPTVENVTKGIQFAQGSFLNIGGQKFEVLEDALGSHHFVKVRRV